jgi:DNA-directed RNA polymerase specialized sigma24 family protein
MLADFRSLEVDEYNLNDGQLWGDLLVWLLPIVKIWVYNASIANWHRQQREIAEEITQEAVMRTYIRTRDNESSQVVHIKAFCRRTARNCFIDRIKREKRIIHLSLEEFTSEAYLTIHEQDDPEEIALNHLILEETVINTASAIASFPDKQRAAILTDLANITEFTASPSLLEQALAEFDIQLHDYVRPHCDDPGERSRQSSLLWHAYKRLKNMQDE